MALGKAPVVSSANAGEFTRPWRRAPFPCPEEFAAAANSLVRGFIGVTRGSCTRYWASAPRRSCLAITNMAHPGKGWLSSMYLRGNLPAWPRVIIAPPTAPSSTLCWNIRGAGLPSNARPAPRHPSLPASGRPVRNWLLTMRLWRPPCLVHSRSDKARNASPCQSFWQGSNLSSTETRGLP